MKHRNLTQFADHLRVSLSFRSEYFIQKRAIDLKFGILEHFEVFLGLLGYLYYLAGIVLQYPSELLNLLKFEEVFAFDHLFPVNVDFAVYLFVNKELL